MDKLGNEKDKLIELRFIDSFKFMATSLDSLTRNLVGACALPGSGDKGGEKLFGFENYSELQYERDSKMRVLVQTNTFTTFVARQHSR